MSYFSLLHHLLGRQVITCIPQGFDVAATLQVFRHPDRSTPIEVEACRNRVARIRACLSGLGLECMQLPSQSLARCRCLAS